MFNRFKKNCKNFVQNFIFKNISFLIFEQYFSTTEKHKFVNSFKLFSLQIYNVHVKSQGNYYDKVNFGN